MRLQDPVLWHYRATVTRILDGDTMEVLVDVGFDMTRHTRVRLLGVDCPEFRTKDYAEKHRAIQARDFVIDLCPVDSEVLIRTEKDDSFGRYLADVWVLRHDGTRTNLVDQIIANGHGVRR